MPIANTDATAKKPIVKHEEVIVPIYKFIETSKEIRTLKEIPIEGFGKVEILEFLSSMKNELSKLQEIVKGLVSYKIKEEIVTSQKVKFEDVKVKNPIIEDVRVKNAVVEDIKVKNAIPEYVKVPQVSQKDIDALSAYKKLAEEVLSRLKEIRDYKIKEEIIRKEQHVFVPKKIEVPSEKVVFHVKDEVIETLEELVKNLKKG